MRRLLFVLSIAFNAGLLSFLVTAIIATYWVQPGEPQEGLGLLWYFTLPGTLLVSLLSAALYRVYREPPKGLAPFSIFVILVLLASILGPLVGLAGVLVLHALQRAA